MTKRKLPIKKDPTIKDIARIAQVSPSTVSLVLNKKPGIGEETRARVLRVVEDLNYSPNLVARSLVSRRSYDIAMLITSTLNPLFPETAAGIDEVNVEGEGVGMVRKVRLAGSSDWIIERLIARDDAEMTFTYAIEGEGIPGLTEYTATAQATPTEHGCLIRWECRAVATEEQAPDGRLLLEGMAESIVTLFAAQFS